MLKNEKQSNDPTHFSYSDYRQKVKKRPNKDLMIFVSVFIIGLLIILGFVKILSPNVDVEIASGDEYSELKDEDNSTSSIDERLKLLKEEDSEIKSEDDKIFTSELEEKVVIPKQISKTVGEIESEKQNIKIQEQKKHEEEKKQEKLEKQENEPIIKKSNEPKQVQAPAPAHSVNAKVVVGYYSNADQAEVAKTILQDAGVSATPFVKNMGGYYTLQVGSYSSVEKAEQAANNLLKSNFPARVIVE